MSAFLIAFVVLIIIISCISLYVVTPKYIYYSLLYYKKRFFQDKNSFSRPIIYIGGIFLFAILYLFIDYIPFHEYINKIIPLLPEQVNTYLTSFKSHGAIKVGLLALMLFIILIPLVFLFIKTPQLPQRKIVNDLKMEEIIKYKKINIHSYFGSIKKIKDIQVIVTSENSDLDLASPSSTSISGRVRYMASTKDEIGNIINDPLHCNIKKFKECHKKYNDFNLGTCIPSPPFELEKNNVKCIIHAVSIKKNNDNTIYSDGESIERIMRYSINYCLKKDFDSILIPIFCIGSAQANYIEVIKSQVGLLKSILDSELASITTNLNIYLGVYRELDDLFLKKTLIKEFR